MHRAVFRAHEVKGNLQRHVEQRAAFLALPLDALTLEYAGENDQASLSQKPGERVVDVIHAAELIPLLLVPAALGDPLLADRTHYLDDRCVDLRDLAILRFHPSLYGA